MRDILSLAAMLLLFGAPVQAMMTPAEIEEPPVLTSVPFVGETALPPVQTVAFAELDSTEEPTVLTSVPFVGETSLPPAQTAHFADGVDRIADVPDVFGIAGIGTRIQRLMTFADQRFVTPAEQRILASAERRMTLRALSGAYLVVSLLDWHSTSSALDRGAEERNPLLGPIAPNSSALLVTKVLMAASTAYLAERLWKRNRLAATAIMLGANIAMGFVAAHNTSVAP